MTKEQMGTLRPVTQREHADGSAVRYALEPVGDVTTQVRFAEIEELGITQILDAIDLPFTAAADGFALYDQGGNVLSWWQIVAPPGELLHLGPGWGFKLAGIAGGAKSERAQTVAL